MTLHEKIAQARLLAERGGAKDRELLRTRERQLCLNLMIPEAEADGQALQALAGFDFAQKIGVPRETISALAEALAIAVSGLEHECCCVGDEGPADVCSACLAVREIGKKMGVEG